MCGACREFATNLQIHDLWGKLQRSIRSGRHEIYKAVLSMAFVDVRRMVLRIDL